MTIIEQARERVAKRYRQPYQINAILAGDWDNGSLIKNEIAAIEAEQASCKKK